MARRSADPDSLTRSAGLRRSDRFLAGLQNTERVVLMSHLNPDPDSLGSMLGLAHLVETRLTNPTLLPRDGLRSAAEVVRVEIDRQVAQTEDAAALVQALEEQYDAFARGRGEKNLLAPESGPLPTADELGAELERFLAEQSRPGDTPGS